MPAESEAGQRPPQDVVRELMADMLGGHRGVVEAAVPTLVFTITFVSTHRVPWAIGLSLAAVLPFLVVRIIQRSPVKYALNAVAGIGTGGLFAWLFGGSTGHQALAYFVPGILLASVSATAFLASSLLRWPFIGLVLGSATGDFTSWRRDPALYRLCNRLTLLLAAPSLLKAVGLGSLYVAGEAGWMSNDSAIAALGVAKLVLGWPVYLGSFAAMAWILAGSASDAPSPEGPAEAVPGQD